MENEKGWLKCVMLNDLCGHRDSLSCRKRAALDVWCASSTD